MPWSAATAPVVDSLEAFAARAPQQARSGTQADLDVTVVDDDIGGRHPRNLQQTVKCSTDAHVDVLVGCGWCGHPET